jgi:hypothetical protein
MLGGGPASKSSGRQLGWRGTKPRPSTILPNWQMSAKPTRWSRPFRVLFCTCHRARSARARCSIRALLIQVAWATPLSPQTNKSWTATETWDMW